MSTTTSRCQAGVLAGRLSSTALQICHIGDVSPAILKRSSIKEVLMRPFPTALALGTGAALLAHAATAQEAKPHNLILFVPDGLRALSVTNESAPTLAALRDKGVNFKNPHSLFPTFTMANASGMAFGHHLGDTGAFSNVIFTGYPVAPAANSVTPSIENDAILGDIDRHFDGNFIDGDTILAAARNKGLSTAT